MNEIVGIFGTAITVISFIYAIYENRRNAKLINYNREQAWEIYRQASNVLAVYQDLKKLEINNIKFREDIIQGETFAQELVNNCIHMIKRFEKKFDSETIKKWSEGNLLPNESHAIAFKRIALK